MTDKPLSHEDIERYCDDVPNSTLDLLPNNTESREAKRLQKVVAELAHDSLEKRDDKH